MKRAALVLLLLLNACDDLVEGVPDAGPGKPMLQGGSCPAQTGAGVSHSANITANETWAAADSPHIVTSGFRVEAVLTLEPCVEVRMAEGATITVSGSIVAKGTFNSSTGTLRPVLFVPRETGKKWASLFVQPTGLLDFELVGLVGGGKDNGTTGSTIEARGSQAKPVQPLVRVRDVVIDSSDGTGVVLKSYATFSADSSALTIQGSGAEPLVVQPPAVGTIPSGSYADNGKKEIKVLGVTRLDVDETFHDRGIPYRLDTTFSMYDVAKTQLTLTVDPGVKIRVAKEAAGGYGFLLGNKASVAPVKLLVNGTAEKPVLFTSAAAIPAAGDWAGVMMAFAPAAGNAITFATFEYAGGFTGTRGFDCGPMENNGGLLMIDWRPDTAFVTNSTFRNTLGSGIVSGWTVTAGQTGPDFTPTNTFSMLSPAPPETGSCDVSEWRLPVAAMPCRTTARPTCVGK